MSVLLFVDMLGVNSRWRLSGRDGAELAFRQFRALVNGAIAKTTERDSIRGSIESDAVAIVSESCSLAVKIGLRLFRDAFLSPVQDGGHRFWLRGVIVPWSGGEFIRRTVPGVESPTHGLDIVEYSPALLDAIATERSGFKGMRLLIHRELVTPELRTTCSVSVGQKKVPLFMQLRLSQYPERIDRLFADVLWMAADNESDWEGMKTLLSRRLSRSTKENEEFLHAAATQVVFNECGGRMLRVRRRQGLAVPRYSKAIKKARRSMG
ncbi:MAG: hypothetical protein ACHQ9S_07565 [Candidatus Binatia bacterium]